ncbi:hypothetical protein [Stutzerimonas stutzeri]|uniref:hypothetical protein n=1 Tax=Stutzerimonas stutzeri TaxID=316 RepID=UPI001EF58D28|nr:hypothetical protein [Stutzerimonas stutzeri]CAB5526979.1 Uncharacterised protein [Stutzerimonas stutzeri]CAB5537653.1 Uncharacterised protein [Stutzerimonas stutzeri]CAC9076051.1 Uncharacterised protein [Stutzerimonas stutzeri]
MKKTLLALAITALSANAFAVNLDEKNTTDTFASEIVVKSTGTIIGSDNLSVSSKAGFSVENGFVRVTLDNGAVFAGDPKIAVNSVDVPTALVAGGNGANFAIFSVSDVKKTDVVTVTTAANAEETRNGVKVVNQDAVNVTFALYETASQATTQTTPLYSNSGVLLNFKQALTVAATSKDLDVLEIAIGEDGQNFFTFEGGKKSTPIAALSIEAAEYLDANGDNFTADDAIDTYSWKLSGDFSAAATTVAIEDEEFEIAEDKLSATIDSVSGKVIYSATGEAVIPETTFSAAFTPVAQNGYAVSAKTFSNVSSLVRAGDSDDADLVLKPAGAYQNFVRISNTSNIAGKFFLEVTNDAGDTVTIALNEVEGQPEALAARASTTQMTIDQIFAAAKAKGLELTGQGKLRLKATGQVGTGGVSLQTYTVSKDGNSFATF